MDPAAAWVKVTAAIRSTGTPLRSPRDFGDEGVRVDEARGDEAAARVFSWLH
jgi:hypothetical protein